MEATEEVARVGDGGEHRDGDILGRRTGAKKGGRWMPRLREAKKDVISCEKLR